MGRSENIAFSADPGW